jgi:hypothetical protein
LADKCASRYIGLALAITSTMAIGTSFVITKKGLMDAEERHGFEGDGFTYLKSPIWWAGIVTCMLSASMVSNDSETNIIRSGPWGNCKLRSICLCACYLGYASRSVKRSDRGCPGVIFPEGGTGYTGKTRMCDLLDWLRHNRTSRSSGQGNHRYPRDFERCDSTR